jgi:signal transduction histidine kinase
LWLLALAVAVPCAAVIAYSIASDARHDEHQAEATTLSVAQLIGSQIQQFVTDATNVAATLAKHPQIRALDPNVRDPVFNQFLELHPQFANLIVRDASGRLIQSAVAAPADSSLAGPIQWLEAVMRNQRFTVGKPAIGRVTRRWICVFGYPIRNATGQVAGALGMSVDLARFRFILNQASLAPESSVTIIDEQGIVILRSPGSAMWLGKPAPDAKIVEIALAAREGHKIAPSITKEDRIFGFTTIPSADWHVLVGIPTRVAFAAARANTLRAALAGTSLLGLVLALVLVVGRLIKEPVAALAEAAAAAAEGRPGQPVPVAGPKEIATVTREFNRMVALRQQKEAEIQQLNQDLERRVQERTAQLEAANTELEAFSYSVSHDLRAPLRGIDGFSKVLLEDYNDKLDEIAKGHLERVRGAVARMSELIDDLLKLSRISRAEMKRGVVDLSATARELTTGLQHSAPDRAVAFVIQPEMIAHGDARLLRVALENLLNNAWKFTRKASPARIEFGAAPVEGQTAFYIRDNGAGFDMAYVSKLFGAFQRLHAPADYEGTGIGLATVQRIVRRHGGRVWAEGKPGEGATFYFTVPG